MIYGNDSGNLSMIFSENTDSEVSSNADIAFVKIIGLPLSIDYHRLMNAEFFANNLRDDEEPISRSFYTMYGSIISTGYTLPKSLTIKHPKSRVRGEVHIGFDDYAIPLPLYLYINDSIHDIKPSISNVFVDNFASFSYDETEGQTENHVIISQNMDIFDDTALFGYFQDDSHAPAVGPYIFFDNHVPLYEYRLESDSPVEYEGSGASVADDFRGSSLEMVARGYTIIDADSVDGILDKLTLMAAGTGMWLTQGQSITKEDNGVEHTITMLDVVDDESKCGFDVDGSTVWIKIDEAATVSGITLYVTDATAVHNADYDADVCKVYISDRTMTLEEGKPVLIDNDYLYGSNVSFKGTAGSWEGLSVTWQPTEPIYLAPVDELVDPVFGKVWFGFDGVDATYETISFNLTDMNKDDFNDVCFGPQEKEEDVTPVVSHSNGGGGGGGGHSRSCFESWTCKNWSECSITGIQARDCHDQNNCTTVNFKPVTSRSCTFVAPVQEPVKESNSTTASATVQEGNITQDSMADINDTSEDTLNTTVTGQPPLATGMVTEPVNYDVRWGNVAIAAVVILALAGAGYWFFKRK